MSQRVIVTANTSDLGYSSRFGGHELLGSVVAKGDCPYCGAGVGFRQISTYERSETSGFSVAVRCDICHAISAIGISDGDVSLYPSPNITGLVDVPPTVDKYYQEALSCLSAEAPSGAATLFRKTIHAIAIHYEIAEIDDSMGIYEMINKLKESGEINEKLRRSLLGVKDLGNDGAHINKNEPDIEQAMVLKGMIDSVLSATVIADQQLETTRSNHPNKFTQADDNSNE